LKERIRIASTILLTFAITVTAVLTAEYHILGKDTVKLAFLSYIINKKYTGEIDNEAQYKAYVSALGDVYTRYIDKEEYTAEYIDRNKYVGIGIVVAFDTKDKLVRVTNVTRESPAENAGIIAGDIIYSADDAVFNEENYMKAADYIRGEENTSVKIGILRGGETIYMDIVRKSIKASSVRGYMYNADIGIINLISFDKGAGLDFEKAYDELVSLGMKKMIINLDYNGGGMLNEAMYISDMFFPKGTLVTYMQFKDGKRTDYVTSYDAKIDMPTVILVNRYSASASEMFSGAMQHYKKAVLVGEKTYGKGIAQSIISFPDMTALSVTEAKYYIPSGICIHGEGLTPDYEVSMEESLDEQFEKAVEILSQQEYENAD